MKRLNIDLRLKELEAETESLRKLIRNTRPNMERVLKLSFRKKPKYYRGALA